MKLIRPDQMPLLTRSYYAKSRPAARAGRRSRPREDGSVLVANHEVVKLTTVVTTTLMRNWFATAGAGPGGAAGRPPGDVPHPTGLEGRFPCTCCSARSLC